MNKHLKKHPNSDASSVKGDKKQTTMSTIQKKLELSNLPSRDHEPQPSTSTSKAPKSDTLLTAPSPSDVERIPILISGDDTLEAQFEHFYSVMRLKVENIFDNVDHVALTCDIWSEMMTVTTYLGVTAHYLQEDKLVSRCIATVALDQRHTGDFIAEKSKEICVGIYISLDKITAVVTDNGSNMIAGIANFLEKNKHLPGFAHTINLIAESAMSVNDLETLVSTGSQPLKLILDVYYMLQRYIELAPIVHQILMLNTKAPPTPSAVEMQNIKTLICILKPLEYVTEELSGEQL
ncbi:uncharacterized protein LOC113371332 [Ctenocephalides felis]|uniref:uncharacterized protein LOC113371332 n=1 Tax=Ctenocephalides felis TaxID=7515 RepID=UPI000E6E3590|nr:uncharacterized protein LOC113371332 [Ctenocephalides felis]